MKFPHIPDDYLAELLRDAARKIEAGEPLRFPDSETRYLQGPVVVAVLRGLADGKTLGQVMKVGAPPKRLAYETYVEVERAKRRTGSYRKAFEAIAKDRNHAESPRRRGTEVKEHTASGIKKEYQRARSRLKPMIEKIANARKAAEERAKLRQADAGKTLAELLKGHK